MKGCDFPRIVNIETSTMEAPTQLPPFFPLKLRKCADVADTFFGCFDDNTVPNGDKDLGRKALETCQDKMKLYVACMSKFKPNKR
ncbi:hypothetical protein BC829DRAFT_400424 [Chytridium lagenaria]|nr:hypothetical protein BC829DRAFT_400424 [Chytridium lagenaria]